MKTQKVTVVPYDEAWDEAFERIKGELLPALGDLIVGIEHVGSTAVSGLSAKPCIDIDIIIEDNSMLPSVISALREIGYIHEGDLGIKGREAFCYSDKPHLMKHHLYVCPSDSDELLRHIKFRDFLRSHPEAMAEYGRVKEEGARLYPDDIDKYIKHKSPCIEKMYAECGLSAPSKEGAGLKEKAKRLKIDIPAVLLALKDRRTPWYAKVFAALTVVYAFSPIDLIPDFIPILGYLDDLVILPLLVALTVKLIPKELFYEYRERAREAMTEDNPKRWYYAIPIVTVWAVVIFLIARVVFF